MQYSKPTFSCLLIRSWHFSICESLTYNYILSISGWCFTRLRNAFLTHVPEPLSIAILYEWSKTLNQSGSCSTEFSPVTLLKQNIFVLFHYIAIFNFFIFAYYVFTLPSLPLNGILSTYSVNALSSLLLNLCCDFNIDLSPFKIYLRLSFSSPTTILFFSNQFIAFSSWFTSW